MSTGQYAMFYVCTNCNKKIHKDYMDITTETCDICLEQNNVVHDPYNSSQSYYSDEMLLFLFIWYMIK
jgi:hypothetical protein